MIKNIIKKILLKKFKENKLQCIIIASIQALITSLLPIFLTTVILLGVAAGAMDFLQAFERKAEGFITQLFDFFHTEYNIVEPGQDVGKLVIRGYCDCEECARRLTLAYDEEGNSISINYGYNVAFVDKKNPVIPVGSKIEVENVEYTVVGQSYIMGDGVNIYLHMNSHAEVDGFGTRTRKVKYSKSNTENITVDTRGSFITGLVEHPEDALIEKADEKDDDGEYVLDNDFFENIHLSRQHYKDLLSRSKEYNEEKPRKKTVKYYFTCNVQKLKGIKTEVPVTPEEGQEMSGGADENFSSSAIVAGNYDTAQVEQQISIATGAGSTGGTIGDNGNGDASSEQSVEDTEDETTPEADDEFSEDGEENEETISPEEAAAIIGKDASKSYTLTKAKRKKMSLKKNFESAAIEGQFKVQWQVLFALYQMAARERMAEWSRDKYSLTNKESTEVNFLTDEEEEKLIEAGTYEYAYYYDGTRGPSTIKEDEFENVCYEVVDASKHNSDSCYMTGSIKEPVSVPYCVTNAFDCIIANVDESTHKLLGYRRIIDPQYTEQALEGLIDDWNWDLFMDLLRSYPDSDSVVEFYLGLEEASATGAPYEEEIPIEQILGYCPTGDIYIGSNITEDDYMYSDGFDHSLGGNAAFLGVNDYFGATANVHLPLDINDGLTADQMETVVETYILSNNVTNSRLIGTGAAFVQVGNDYNISALGLLGLACNESGFGTSTICRDKNNFFGWGAYDSNPYYGAYSFSGASAGVYDVGKKISLNYVNSESYHQNTFYKMRWNNGVHQYATDTAWDQKAAFHRAKLMLIAAQLGYISEDRANEGGLTAGGETSPEKVSGDMFSVSAESINQMTAAAVAICDDPTVGYMLGCRGPKYYDCSGFVYALYQTYLGITINPSASNQYHNCGGREISESELQPGDLIFCERGGAIKHVAMYIGNGRTAEATGRWQDAAETKEKPLQDQVKCKNLEDDKRYWPTLHYKTWTH